MACCYCITYLVWLCFPSKLFPAPTSFVITDKDDQLLNASIAEDGQWRFPYDENVPEKFSKCITTFEDKRFFYHPGVDPIAMGRAVCQNIKGNGVVSGGSTLTMQVIRLAWRKKRTFLINSLKHFCMCDWNVLITKKQFLLYMHPMHHLAVMWLDWMQHHGDILEEARIIKLGRNCSIGSITQCTITCAPGKKSDRNFCVKEIFYWINLSMQRSLIQLLRDLQN